MAGKKVAKVEKVVKVEEAIKQSASATFFSKKILIVAVVAVLLVLGFYKKSWFIAATVNGSPITFLEVLGKLNEEYKPEALDQIISKKIILDEARERGVQVNKQEIDGKISEIEGQYGGTAGLDSILSQQGQTRKNLVGRIEIQLALEKLYSNEATVSPAEVDSFIKESGALLQSTDSAKQREEAEDALKQQKLSQIFPQKFQELKQQAKIRIF